MRRTVEACSEPTKIAAASGARRWLSNPAIIGAGLLAVSVWSYWPTLCDLFEFWRRNPDYSSGALVPLVVAYLLWSDRKVLLALPKRVCWWGLAMMLLAQVIRFYGLYDMYGSLERYSVVLTVVGAVLFIFGFQVARRLKWVLAPL